MLDVLVGVDAIIPSPGPSATVLVLGDKPRVKDVLCHHQALLARAPTLSQSELANANSSFTEGCVLFMRRQPEAVLRAIRVIKFMQKCQKARAVEHATFETGASTLSQASKRSSSCRRMR